MTNSEWMNLLPLSFNKIIESIPAGRWRLYIPEIIKKGSIAVKVYCIFIALADYYACTFIILIYFCFTVQWVRIKKPRRIQWFAAIAFIYNIFSNIVVTPLQCAYICDKRLIHKALFLFWLKSFAESIRQNHMASKNQLFVLSFIFYCCQNLWQFNNKEITE